MDICNLEFKSQITEFYRSLTNESINLTLLRIHIQLCFLCFLGGGKN